MVRQAEFSDLPLLTALAGKLWPDHDPRELALGFEEANRIICFVKKL